MGSKAARADVLIEQCWIRVDRGIPGDAELWPTSASPLYGPPRARKSCTTSDGTWSGRLLGGTTPRDGQRARKEAAENAKEEGERQAKYYNAHRSEVAYQVGDEVMKKNRILSLATRGISSKLAPKFANPMKIVAITGTNTVRVMDGDGQKEEVLHVSHLKPFSRPESDDDTGVDVDEEPQSPRDGTSDPGMSDPPEVSGAPSTVADVINDVNSLKQDYNITSPMRNTSRRSYGYTTMK